MYGFTNLLFLFSLPFYLARLSFLSIIHNFSDFPALSRYLPFPHYVKVFRIDLATKLIEFFVEIRASIGQHRKSARDRFGTLLNAHETFASSICIQRGRTSVKDAGCMSSLVCCESKTKIAIVHFCGLVYGPNLQGRRKQSMWRFYRDAEVLVTCSLSL